MKNNRPQPLEWGLLFLILLIYGGLAAAYAIRTPDWQVPDETAHYNYVRQIAEQGALPVIQMGDWRQDYQNMMTACAFHPAVLYGDPSRVDNMAYLEACGYDPALAVGFEVIQYEDHQPPLYYLLQTPIYLATDGDLLAMRLFSAVLGAVAVAGAWTVVRLLCPVQPWLALSTAALMAFIPQRLAIMGGVSNDALAEALAALVLLGVVFYLRQEKASGRVLLALGVLVGLVFLTKTTVYYAAGIAGLAILLRWRREKWDVRTALKQIALFALPALVLGLIWWGHGVDTYGGTDFLGLQEHDEVVVGQPRTEDYIETQYGGSQRIYWENLTRTTFQSFWGQFGWMAYPMQPRIYTALRMILGILLLGALIQSRQVLRLLPWQRDVLLLLGLAIALVTLQFLLYNMTFVQFQGRYLYPALIPLSLIFAFALQGYLSLLARFDRRVYWLGVPIAMLLAAFALYALREVLPAIPDWG